MGNQKRGWGLGRAAELIEQEKGRDESRGSAQTHNFIQKFPHAPQRPACYCMCVDLCYLYFKVYFEVLLYPFPKSAAVS